MTLDQALAFAIVGGMMALFVWGRLRYDLVAMLALLAAVAVGIVPPDRAFSGFGDDIVIIVGSALVVSAAIARSGVAENLLRPVAPYLTTATRQVLILVAVVTVLSAFVKNVGALAGHQQARRRSAGAPGELKGDRHVMTLVGTSPNVLVSRLRADLSKCSTSRRWGPEMALGVRSPPSLQRSKLLAYWRGKSIPEGMFQNCLTFQSGFDAVGGFPKLCLEPSCCDAA